MSIVTVDVYDPGTAVVCEAVFRDPDTGAPADPTAVEFLVRTPGGVETVETWPDSVAVLRVEPGRFTRAVLASEVGMWRYRARGTGTWRATKQGLFRILPFDFTTP